ncbi:chromosome segregation protein SMC [Candidatus Latescibacterota bacterium]
MRLKRLEIYGFKSFAKKLDLKLVGGITGVVGPNGCGKTNVVDAIRWVLGEQRPTQIRLDRMEDVLFKGSGSRRPLGMAEVSLTIDNDAGLLPLDMAEITITRRLFRTGESDYMINKKACRLTDINELFMDTGMGTDSYSMFEQNMINSILSDKAEDRRHIFEEAAGVTKYKTRRRSAVGKLASIQDDLDRVGDIVTELERRVESLKRQASKAGRYRKYKDEIKERSVAIAGAEIAQLAGEVEETYQGIQTLKLSIESTKTRSAQLNADNEQLSVDIVDVESKLADNAGEFNANQATINEKEKELARLSSRLDYLGEKADHDREDTRRTAEALEKLAQSHGSVSGELAQVTARLEDVERSCASHIEEYREFERSFEAKVSEHHTIEQDSHRLERDLAEQRSSLETVRMWGENGKKRLTEIVDRSGEVEKTIREATDELELLRTKCKTAVAREQEMIEGLGARRKSIEDKRTEVDDLSKRLEEFSREEATIAAERDFLTEIVLTGEGYSDGVRNVITAAELQDRVRCVLADVISVDPVHVLAMETALGDRLQNVLVNTRDDAMAGVRYLVDSERGRATFLPVEAPPVEPLERDVPTVSGVIGPAWQFVRTESHLKPVMQRLLDGVLLVETLETALVVQGGSDQWMCVTLAGEKAGWWGDIEGGTAGGDDSKSIIGRMEKLEELNLMTETAAMEIETLTGSREELSDEIDFLRASIREHESEIESIRREVRDIQSEEAHVSAKKEAAEEMLTNWTVEADRIRESFGGYNSEVQEIEKSIAEREKELSIFNETLKNSSEEMNSIRLELEKKRTATNGYSVEKAALTEKKASLGREVNSLQERRESLAHTANRLQEDIAKTEREVLEVGCDIGTELEKLEELSVYHEQIRKVKDEIELKHADLASRRSEIERNLQLVRRDLADLMQRESSLSLKRDQASMRMQTLIERLEHEFYVSAEDIPMKEDDPDKDTEQERLVIEDLRRKLHAMGDVNMTAETEYNEEKQRLDFLRNERDDLVEARDVIEKTITKINQIARRRFIDTFELIRINFQKTFDTFFNGGVCDLTLEDEADPLEAKIQISARPPGKNVRSISLLSSGERALTAIAMLFAIYQVKPSPFCILDEVDAPLDDANIERYLRVIRQFSKTTQFIMVTHSKKTMAAADNLYGITMEEPGLSTLVSVRLSRSDVVEEDVAIEEKAEESVK